jgi:hypothetical protein
MPTRSPTPHLELAYDYFAEAALMDLENLEHNTRDGLHIASLAGAWVVAVAGFGGMRDYDGTLSFTAPPPTATHPPDLRHVLSRQSPEGAGHPRAGPLLAPTRIAATDHPPRQDDQHHNTKARELPDPGDRRRRRATATPRTQPDTARHAWLEANHATLARERARQPSPCPAHHPIGPTICPKVEPSRLLVQGPGWRGLATPVGGFGV